MITLGPSEHQLAPLKAPLVQEACKQAGICITNAPNFHPVNPRNLLYSFTAKTSTPNCVRAEVASGLSSNLIARLLGNGIIYEFMKVDPFMNLFFCRLTVAVSKKIIAFFFPLLPLPHTKKHKPM